MVPTSRRRAATAQDRARRPAGREPPHYRESNQLMDRSFLLGLAGRLTRLGADPADGEDLRLRKKLLVGSVFLIIPAGLVWGSIYAWLGEPLAASIPFAYSILSLGSVFYFASARRYTVFRTTQLLLILALPFLLSLALGGIAASSGMIVWSFLCPAGAALFDEPRHAVRWFLAFLALVLVSAALEPLQGMTSRLPLEAALTFFVMNISAVSAITFPLLLWFVAQKESALRLLRVEQEKSERLLLNILPREIADDLKHERRTIADRFDAASVLFADMMDFTHLDFRIGISSGPVIAGVIGRRKFIYDLWGDSVNAASRMETHGAAGRIQITRETYELLQHDFHCEPRGTVDVKGKGPIETWFLLGRRDDVGAVAHPVPPPAPVAAS